MKARWIRPTTWAALTAAAVLLLGASAAREPKPPSAAGAAGPVAADGQTTVSGERVYAELCAHCHGLDGRGDGPAAGLLRRAPTDLTAGVYKLRSTAPGRPPSRDDLEAVVRRGAASMPGFADLLTDEQIDAVIERVASFAPELAGTEPRPLDLGDAPPSSGEAVARGRAAYERLGCATCHGADGRKIEVVLDDLQDEAGQPLPVPSLDEPWTFTGGDSPRDLAHRFLAGIDGTPMPSYGDQLEDGEVWDLAAFVRSLARRPVWEMDAAEVERFYAEGGGVPDEPVARGRYLVETMSCGACHTPMRSDGGLVEELQFAGGMRFDVGPFGDVFASNLTSDPETGLGSWSDEEIARAISKGQRPDGSYMEPFPMPWISYGTLAERDVEAIVAYLRTLPPIVNEIPENRSAGFFPYLWGKFEILILRRDFPSVTFSGNAGSAPMPDGWDDWPPVPVAAYGRTAAGGGR